ncbi:RDD family protein [Pseudomarimonas arenosa]|uniref:RDD family protein n=1 Tax=Pseudomarimonas arenosa TaxID=2774145 RepID=A0AAW3ZKY7_9GAMM|nr:RDD family protein [Pseudomarimonas arenosa]
MTHELADQDVVVHALPRIPAFLIDAVVVALLALPLLWLTILNTQSLRQALGADATLALLLLPSLLLLMLPALMDSLSSGSIGKRMMQLRVVDARGRRPNLLRSLSRHAVKLLVHGLLPGIWLLAERLLLRGLNVHDWLCGTRVVASGASAAQLARVLPASFAPTLLGQALRAVFAIGAALLLFLVGSAWLAVILVEPNPTRKALAPLVEQARGISRASENQFYKTGRFTDNLSELGLAEQTAFSTVKFNAQNGSFILRLNSEFSELHGRSLLLYPELKRGDRAEVRRWRCGSPDITAEHLPFGCRDSVAGYE